MAQPRDLEYLGEIELDEETARHANAVIEQAERDIAERAGEVCVHLRTSIPRPGTSPSGRRRSSAAGR